MSYDYQLNNRLKRLIPTAARVLDHGSHVYFTISSQPPTIRPYPEIGSVSDSDYLNGHPY